MSSDLLGLRAPPPPDRESPTGGGAGGAGRGAAEGAGRRAGGRSGRRATPPPFRRRSSAVRGTPPRGVSPGPPLLVGLSRGGAAEAFPERSRRREATVIGASFTAHLLLLLALLGRLIPLPDRPPQPLAEEEPEPLLYAFEAPPEVPEAEVVPLSPLPPEPPPEPEPEPAPAAEAAPPPPAAALVIPKAQIGAPSTGFQNDLPFSDGDLDEFFTDREAGEDPEAPLAERDDPPDLTAFEPEPAPEEEFALPEPPAAPDEPPPADEPPAADAPVGEDDLAALIARDRLRFDSDAFRERIRDPAAEVRRRAAAIAREKARVMAREEERERGEPTDIWRFLEGKRFRNPEGGLVSNRNNTLYYDDRGANLVPWITRLIAEVRRNWYIPYAASYQAGHVAIAISVLRSGALSWLQVVIPSGVPGFDNAAEGALRGAQLLPLPDDYPGEDFEIMLVFWYNERPYDLFGSPP